MQLQFDSKIAEIYGVDGAVMLSNLAFWIRKNAANEKHVYDGNVWTYNSMKAFSDLFPFWSEKQIRRILLNLEESGAIMRGNFNENTYDRTIWYALSLAAQHQLGLVSEMGKCICPNGQMDSTKRANGFDQTGKCNKEQIINTYSKPDRGAIDFIREHAEASLEVVLMKYKTNIPDWPAFETYFNCKVVEEELKWETSILLARLERAASSWMRNVKKSSVELNNPAPARKIFK